MPTQTLRLIVRQGIMLKKYIDIPTKLWNNIYQTGSSYICDPPILDTDIDYIIFTVVPEDLFAFLEERGFETNYIDYPLETDGNFRSYRKEKLNLIITDTYDFYLSFVKATDLAKKLNLREKQQRIDLFQYILYDC